MNMIQGFLDDTLSRLLHFIFNHFFNHFLSFFLIRARKLEATYVGFKFHVFLAAPVHSPSSISLEGSLTKDSHKSSFLSRDHSLTSPCHLESVVFVAVPLFVCLFVNSLVD